MDRQTVRHPCHTLTDSRLPDLCDKIEELGGIVRHAVVRPSQVLHVCDVPLLLCLRVRGRSMRRLSSD